MVVLSDACSAEVEEEALRCEYGDVARQIREHRPAGIRIDDAVDAGDAAEPELARERCGDRAQLVRTVVAKHSRRAGAAVLGDDRLGRPPGNELTLPRRQRIVHAAPARQRLHQYAVVADVVEVERRCAAQ